MNDRDYKRLRTLFTITWWLFGVVLAIVVVVFIYIHLTTAPAVEVHNYVGQKGDTGAQGVQGIQGATGSVGEQGPAGKDGQNTVTEKVVEHQGDPGPQGEPGEPGRSVEIRRNEETGDIETRYTGDRFWQVLVTACDINPQCGQESDGPGTH